MITEDLLEIVRTFLKQSPVRAPTSSDRVYKEECAFSYDTALSPGGLYLNLSSWLAYGEEYVRLDSQRTGNKLYLHEKAQKVPREEAKKPDERPDKLAIGGEGGFQVERSYDMEKQQWLVVLPEGVRIALPAPELPDAILNAIAAISAHESATAADTAAAWEEVYPVSCYAADLPQLAEGMGRCGRHVPSDPALWACDETGVKENLWLNLSSGFIGSGRRNFDGSGGNGAAQRHFEDTGRRFPLAVKLGTIAPNGADVYSYAEDDMVTDPQLAEHLAHWGINMMAMQKTEKTMTELQIDLNMAYEHDRITESGSVLQPLRGPGYVGLENLGNSCYMNSVLQLLYTVPVVGRRYATKAAERIFETAPTDPENDFSTQMAKLGVALCDGRTGQAGELPAVGNGSAAPEHAADYDETVGDSVRPASFKHLVGRGHAEFSSMRQQDASEFLQHLLGLMGRAERAAGPRLGAQGEGATSSNLEFSIETRVQCSESGRVSYKRDAPSNILGLGIPMDAAANKGEVEEYQEREAKRAKLRESNADAYIPQSNGLGSAEVISNAVQEQKVLPRVPLAACLEKWAADEEMGDYFSAALGRKTRALKRQRIANFPPFLVLQLNRFYLASDWTSKKLEVLVDVPESLDLEALRGGGLAAGEEAQPADPAAATAAEPARPAPPQPDPQIVGELMAMGFSENGSKRAAMATKNTGTQASMDWVLAHMEDADFNDPLPSTSAGMAAGDPPPDPESAAMLASMGFTEQQAAAALKACQGSLERAADWLFSHADDLEAAVQGVLRPSTPAQTTIPDATGAASLAPALQDGLGKYRLVGFISHMGANTACGHYVCHIRRGGGWAIFNDDKVALSENPPTQLGYLYLFQRE